MTDEEREHERAFLVSQTRLASGIIETLEWRDVEPFTDCHVIELGERLVQEQGAGVETDETVEQWALTALKLLARAREAETKVHTLTSARHDDATAHSQDLADLAEVFDATTELTCLQQEVAFEAEVAKRLSQELAAHHALRPPMRLVLPATTDAELIEALRSMTDASPLVHGAELVFRPTIDPTVAALAIVDDLETNGDLGPCAPLPMPPIDDGSPDAKDRLRIHEARLAGRAAQVERLAKVIAAVTHRDLASDSERSVRASGSLADLHAVSRGLDALAEPVPVEDQAGLCRDLLMAARAAWPEEAEQLSMGLPTTGAGMFADLLGVLERCSPEIGFGTTGRP